MAETLDLDAIKARCDEATEGPWWPRWGGEPGFVYSRSAQVVVAEVPRDKSDEWQRADSIFIAHARTDIPALIAEIERLRSGVTADV